MYLTKGWNVRKILMILAFCTMFIFVGPASANTSNWNFSITWDAYVVNGDTNGVYHNMTAGKLTVAGSVQADIILNGAAPGKVTFQVKKSITGFDPTVCTFDTPAVPNSVNTPVWFTNDCGNITAGDYYLIISKGQGWGASGSGTLKTP